MELPKGRCKKNQGGQDPCQITKIPKMKKNLEGKKTLNPISLKEALWFVGKEEGLNTPCVEWWP